MGRGELWRSSWRERVGGWDSKVHWQTVPRLCKKGPDIHFFQFWIYANLPLFHGGNSFRSRFFQKLLVLFIFFNRFFERRIVSHQHDSAGIVATINKRVTFSQGWFWRKSSLRRATTRKKWILWWSVWFRCFSRRFLLWVAKEMDIMIWMDDDGCILFSGWMTHLCGSCEIYWDLKYWVSKISTSQKQDYSDLKFDHGSFLENQHEEIGFLPCPPALLYGWHCRIRRRLRFLTHLQRVFRNGQFGCGTRRGFVAQGWWPSCATFGCIG